MPVLISKFYDLVLDGRAISRTGALVHTGIHWRTIQICANDLMCLFVCISQITGHLIYLHILRVCGKGKWNNFLISKLFFHFVVINGRTVYSCRSTCLKAVHFNTIFHQRIRQMISSL